MLPTCMILNHDVQLKTLKAGHLFCFRGGVFCKLTTVPLYYNCIVYLFAHQEQCNPANTATKINMQINVYTMLETNLPKQLKFLKSGYIWSLMTIQKMFKLQSDIKFINESQLHVQKRVCLKLYSCSIHYLIYIHDDLQSLVNHA